MKLRLLLIVLSLPFNIFSDGLEKFYKKIADKTVGHTMRGIDFIYMINLDHRPEKFLSCVKQLSPYGIDPFRFSAIKGLDIPLETINELGVKYEPWMKENEKDQGCRITYVSNGKNGTVLHYEVMHHTNRVYFHQGMNHGQLGCILSHISVLYDAYYKSDYNTIWVMEDDIKIDKDPRLVSDAIDKLDALVGKDGWDILFTDKDSKFRDGRPLSFIGYAKRPNFTVPDIRRHFVRKKIGPNFIKIGSRFGAHSMIIRRSGMKKILDFIDRYKIFAPYDVEYTLPDIEAYTVAEDIVSADPQALSDIRID